MEVRYYIRTAGFHLLSKLSGCWGLKYNAYSLEKKSSGIPAPVGQYPLLPGTDSSAADKEAMTTTGTGVVKSLAMSSVRSLLQHTSPVTHSMPASGEV